MTGFEGFYDPEEEQLQDGAEPIKTSLVERVRNFEVEISRSGALQLAVAAAIMVPAAVFMVPQMVGAKDALIVKSGSMEPSIETGGAVWVYGSDPSSVDSGDVITFSSGSDQFTTHRVVEVEQGEEGPRFRTKGDNNEDPDPGFVTAEELYGKVGFSAPYLGYAVNFASSGNGFLLLVLVPGLLIMVDESFQIAGEARELVRKGDGDKLVNTVLLGSALLLMLASAGGYAAMKLYAIPPLMVGTGLFFVFVATGAALVAASIYGGDSI